VANAALPKLLATKSLRLREGLLDFVSKGMGKAVVDAMLTILRSPGASPEEKGLVYGRIAASGRADVLATIRSIRAHGRRLAHPIASLSATKDTDGDGLPDAVDANPLVARVLQATRSRRWRRRSTRDSDFRDASKRSGWWTTGRAFVPSNS